MHFRVTGLALVIWLSITACSDTTGPVGNVVEGVDLDALFATPAQSELDAVAAEWALRDPTAEGIVTHVDTVIDASGIGMAVRVVSHDVDGATNHGAVLYDTTLTSPAPVLLYAHGGDSGVTIEELLFLLPFLGSTASDFVWVVPAFRGESLTFGGGGVTLAGVGSRSPWDRDVDDALALVAVADSIEPMADATTLGVLGFSRGAGVALLMGIREPEIDRIVAYFGPTDFFDGYVQDVFADALRGSPPALPGVATMDSRFIQPLRLGDLSIAQVRPELIRRSSVLFADRLPFVQIHHGRSDDVVALSQAESLIAAMTDLGRGPPMFDAHLYPGGTHSPLSLPGHTTRSVDYLSALLATPR